MSTTSSTRRPVRAANREHGVALDESGQQVRHVLDQRRIGDPQPAFERVLGQPAKETLNRCQLAVRPSFARLLFRRADSGRRCQHADPSHGISGVHCFERLPPAAPQCCSFSMLDRHVPMGQVERIPTVFIHCIKCLLFQDLRIYLMQISKRRETISMRDTNC